MKVGRLRNRVTVQSSTDTVNDCGELVQTWATFEEVYAEVRSVSGREYLQTDKVRAEVSHVITIRYLAGLLPNMRIVHGTKTFEIVAILPDRTDARMMQIMCNQQVQ